MPRDDSDAGKLTPKLLLRAYSAGIFPMADSSESEEIYWVDPKLRGILPLDKLHISRRLRRSMKTSKYIVTIDTAFGAVMAGCAGRDDTWINSSIITLYSQLHAMGYAHSVEIWEEDDLVGGLYGVSIGGAFFGESMFSRAPNTSKMALIYLVARLRVGGYILLDTQFTTDHLGGFGVIEIKREKYHIHLEKALHKSASFARMPQNLPHYEVLQLSTQTS